MRIFLICLAMCLTLPAWAVDLETPFENIDGGTLRLSDWSGQPVLVVNTASRCGFTPQYTALQGLYDRYRASGLVVLAVPSDDFRQELDSNEEIKEFCELTFGIDLPMTGLTHVRGPEAHPFFQSVADETGFTPGWNFNKILIAPDGQVAGTWGAPVSPTSRKITQNIDALLAR